MQPLPILLSKIEAHVDSFGHMNSSHILPVPVPLLQPDFAQNWSYCKTENWQNITATLCLNCIRIVNILLYFN